MIIALNGLKGSGKDTVGAYLVKEYGFERKAFADPLKRCFAALFDIPFEKYDEWKNNPDVSVTIHTGWDDDFSPITQFSIRQIMQRLGTEAHRDVFGTDFWVNQALPVAGFYAGRKIVVTDCRFPNEAERVKLLGGHVVRIIRPGLDESEDQHTSETLQAEVKPDYVIMNDSSTHDLFKQANSMLEWLAAVEAGL